MATAKIKDTPAAWEDGELGRDAQFVEVAGADHESALSEALDMQAISIRLPKELIKQYKLIAGFHGVGYQPLMRDILHRFVPGALKEILEQQIKAEEKKPPREPLVPLPLKKSA